MGGKRNQSTSCSTKARAQDTYVELSIVAANPGLDLFNRERVRLRVVQALGIT